MVRYLIIFIPIIYQTVRLLTVRPHVCKNCQCDKPAARPPRDITVPNDDRLISKKEACAMLHVSPTTMQKIVNERRLNVYRKKGAEGQDKPRVWLLESEVIAYSKSCTLHKDKENV